MPFSFSPFKPSVVKAITSLGVVDVIFGIYNCIDQYTNNECSFKMATVPYRGMGVYELNGKSPSNLGLKGLRYTRKCHAI